ncbi:hypothetical protein ACNTMW_32835 [Planosporangium sp. 12N6]|uniref:hypothetical protein n=1 Tax=Planosporangium spinosum TaxID=3402278 RepID=UPI003CFB4D35
MNKPDDEQLNPPPQIRRAYLHLKKAEGEPFVVPEAEARPEPDATPPDYHPARAVPKEPLPPQD